MIRKKRPPFNPAATARAEATADPPRWATFRAELQAMPVDQLRAENARLFGQGLAMPQVVAKLWMLNAEFTTRGIAPRWRDAPPHVQHNAPETVDIPIPGVGPVLTEATRRKRLLRWVDLAWLRHELGAGHPVQKIAWSYVFATADQAERDRLFSLIVEQESANTLTLDDLGVPKLHRLALLGFQTSPVRDRFRTLDKWMGGPLDALLVGMTTRRRYPITADELDARKRDLMAIELASGSPTDAALIRRWMTGQAATRFVMHERKKVLAAQLAPLRRRIAWS